MISAKMKHTARSLYIYLTIFSVFLLTASFVLQFHFNQNPCNLCIIDRIIVLSLVLIFVAAIWHNPKTWRRFLYCLLGLILSLCGIGASLRHLWILYQPHESLPACAPGFSYLISTLPLKEAFLIILQGSGECTIRNNDILGVPLPGWTLLAFIILSVGCVLAWKKCLKKG